MTSPHLEGIPPEKVIDSTSTGIWTDMNATHTQHSNYTDASPHADHGIDWSSQIKLAIVLSTAAAIAVMGLANRVAEPVLIVAVIVVASAVAWSRVAPLSPTEL
ncbi:MAG: hypothetical protein WCK21_04945 [Actinomycetota bacterium]